MKRQVPGLAETARDSRPEIPDGIFLVRVDGAQFRWHAHKPFYILRLYILEPSASAGQSIVGRLYCTQKAIWKLGWFLRDFLYDPELLAHEQVDEKALPGLRGVVKISQSQRIVYEVCTSLWQSPLRFWCPLIQSQFSSSATPYK